jgi:hypothetical protein
LVKINSAINQIAGMVTERSGQGHGASGVLRVGLHAAQQCGDRLSGRLFGSGLINSQLRCQLVHRNVSQDVIYSSHR